MTVEPEPAQERPDRGGAVVTGVGWGAGFHIAQTLAGRGYAVHVADLDGALANRAAAELGPPAFGSALDVRSPAASRAVAARTRRRVGSLKLWVNNATALSTGAVWELDGSSRQRMLDVNLVGAINGTLAALEFMRTDQAGGVVNVISLPKLLSAPGQAVYSASRQAIIAFSLGVRADLRRAGLNGVHVSCLCPSAELGQTPAGDAELGASTPPALRKEVVSLLTQVLDDPEPLLATPEWRARLLRFYYLWPGPAKAARRALAGAMGAPARPRSRRRAPSS